MIVVTGAAGFIGSNVLLALNEIGIENIIAVDDLSDGQKFRNLVESKFTEYVDKDEFREVLRSGSSEFSNASCFIHLGACSDTTEWNGKYMLDTNYSYSKDVLNYCLTHQVRLVYASSAAVYGLNDQFAERPLNETPLNVYGYSKLLFDQHVRRLPAAEQSMLVGLRYFNVYGPRESHKGKMASVFFHFYHQLLEHGGVKLFSASHGYQAGEHERDFIYSEDAVAVTLWAALEAKVGGIFNCGTGRATSFNRVANAVIGRYGDGEISYIDMPDTLHDAYQSYTCANLDSLRNAGYNQEFLDVEQGAARYLDWLAGNF